MSEWICPACKTEGVYYSEDMPDEFCPSCGEPVSEIWPQEPLMPAPEEPTF